jgi:hypothetical protein
LQSNGIQIRIEGYPDIHTVIPGYMVLLDVHTKGAIYIDVQNYLGNRDLGPGRGLIVSAVKKIIRKKLDLTI